MGVPGGQYQYWVLHDKAGLKKLNQLIRECQRHPFEGTGKPEPLKGNLSGYWSRRIDREHRLVYRISLDCLEIIQCRYHYRAFANRLSARGGNHSRKLWIFPDQLGKSVVCRHRELMYTMSDAVLIETLKTRFESNMQRHPGFVWAQVEARLLANPAKLKALANMERTGGEPDVAVLDGEGVLTFVDCAAESPIARRSLCYDRAALDARKANKPVGAAVEMAAEIGAEILNEAQYRALQGLGEFDNKTSSWIRTPDRIRALGGAIFCDRRFGTVFTYHNGAESYYAGRGFRCLLEV